MKGIMFCELWEELKNESKESREFFQTAENVAKIINLIAEERAMGRTDDKGRSL